jgi:hypothetical protein
MSSLVFQLQQIILVKDATVVSQLTPSNVYYQKKRAAIIVMESSGKNVFHIKQVII